MKRLTEQKIVIITQKTRLDNLIRRYNTQGQSQFYIEHHGGDFGDYLSEDRNYKEAVRAATGYIETYGRLQIVDRECLPGFMFGENDIVVVIGRDGLVANTMKYLDNQKLIGVNPDPQRWDGVLLPFSVNDLDRIIPETADGIRNVKNVTLAQASLNDGQTLIGVNDIFIGQRTHASARYELNVSGAKEAQSSSGIIISTGLGSTGWFKSVITGARGIDRYCGIHGNINPDEGFGWDSSFLYYTVREPYPSKSTGATLVFGKINKGETLRVTSYMAENGVIFSDGMEQDYLEFNSGATVTVDVCKKIGKIVV